MATSVPSRFAKVIDRDYHGRWFKSSQNRSHLSFRPTAKISSTHTTAMTATDPASINRKTHASARLCSKPRLLRRTTRWFCHDLDACFKPYRLRFKRTTLPGQCSAALWHSHQDHLLKFGLDKRLLHIEMTKYNCKRIQGAAGVGAKVTR